jgi:hypothetical protein
VNSSNSPITATGEALSTGGYQETANPKHQFGGKRWLVLYELTTNSSYQIVSATLVGATADDQSIFDFTNQTSQKVFTSPVNLQSGKIYAVGYLISGWINPLGGSPTCYAQNYAETTDWVSSSAGLAEYGISPGITWYGGGTAQTYFPSYSVQHSGNVATVRVQDAFKAGLIVGQQITVSGLPSGYNGTFTISSIAEGVVLKAVEKEKTAYNISTTAVIQYTTPTSFTQASTLHYTGYISSGTILSSPPATLDGPLTPKQSVSRRHVGTTAYITLNNVNNLYVGQRIVVQDVGAAYNTSALITAISGNEIAYTAGNTNESSTPVTTGKVYSSAMLNYAYNGAAANSSSFRRPWLRLEV